MAELGTVLGGRYRLEQVLGQGGMATIFRATDGQLGRSVAVKVLRSRDAREHGYPILIGDLLAQLEGTAYAARGSVHDAASVMATGRMLRRALETQEKGLGFSFVEVLTMCPTGWFIPTAEGPDYLDKVMGSVHTVGELKRKAHD